jgi:hypothetical protein
MEEGNVGIGTTNILLMESYPVQVLLQLVGNLSNPCHQLRANVSEPDDQNRIMIELYSLVESGKVCSSIIEEIDVQIPIGSFSDGDYTVWVNGEQVGEFSLP